MRPSDSLEAWEDLREQAVVLLQHYPDVPHMTSASWRSPSLFGKPPLSENAEKAKIPWTLSGWISWLFFEDSERGQTVVAGIGLAGGLIGLVSFLFLNY